VWVCVCRVDGDSFLDRAKAVYSKNGSGEADGGNEFNWRKWGVSQARPSSRNACTFIVFQERTTAEDRPQRLSSQTAAFFACVDKTSAYTQQFNRARPPVSPALSPLVCRSEHTRPIHLRLSTPGWQVKSHLSWSTPVLSLPTLIFSPF